MKNDWKYCSLAISIAISGLAALEIYCSSIIQKRYFNEAWEFRDNKLHRISITQEAIKDPNTLLMFGSSELLADVPFKGVDFFSTKPFGFHLFPIGKAGTSCFSFVQKIGAQQIPKNTPLVISLSPSFFLTKAIKKEYVIGNSSLMQMYQILLGTYSLEFKRKFLKRVENFEEFTKQDWQLNTLKYCLEKNLILYYMLYPYFWMQQRIEISKDIVESAIALEHDHKKQTNLSVLDWTVLLEEANKISVRKYKVPITNTRTEKEFTETLDSAEEWLDLEMLLDLLEERKIPALILSMPIHTDILKSQGISDRAMAMYENKLKQIVTAKRMHCFYFKEFENNVDFFLDNGDHLSSKGWIEYNKKIVEYWNACSRKN